MLSLDLGRKIGNLYYVYYESEQDSGIENGVGHIRNRQSPQL